MIYPKTVLQITDYSIDEKGIKRITLQTAKEYIQFQPSNVYLIEGKDQVAEIETLLGCMEIEDKDSKSLGAIMEDVKDLVDDFFGNKIPTSKILEHEFNQRALDLAAGKTGIYALDNEKKETN